MSSELHATPLFVSADATESLFRWDSAIAALRSAYAESIPDAATPPRSVGRVDGAWLRCLPAVPPASRYFGAKLMGLSSSADAPGAQYVIVLFDRRTSSIAAFIDGNLLTAYRTAATSAAALEQLTDQQPLRVGILGSGLEAAMHLRALATIRELVQVCVYSPTPDRRSAFALALTTELGIPVIPVGAPREATAGAEVVLAAARSYGEVPVLYGDWLEEEASVVSVGSTVPEQRELHESVIDRCGLIVCDAVEEVLEQTGDMIEARDRGISFDDKVHSLHALVTGQIDDLLKSVKLRLFKSVGSGFQDVVLASELLERAKEAGLAQSIPIHFTTKG